MDSLEARITARAVGIDRLNRYTVWIGVVAMGAVAAFAVIAAATIPGKAESSIQRAGSSASANASTSTGDPVTYHHHDDFGNSSSISASSGPPIAVSGGSR